MARLLKLLRFDEVHDHLGVIALNFDQGTFQSRKPTSHSGFAINNIILPFPSSKTLVALKFTPSDLLPLSFLLDNFSLLFHKSIDLEGVYFGTILKGSHPRRFIHTWA